MKKKQYIPKPFESGKGLAATSANIYYDMQTSAAYKRLSLGARATYTAMKSTYYSTANKNRPNPQDRTLFYFPHSLRLNTFAITASRTTFLNYVAELIEKGFIDCVERGRNTRTKNIYQFSNRWQKYGTADFKQATAATMTLSLIQKTYKN